MGWIHLFVCGLMLVTVFGYKLSCPDQLHRNIREQNCTEEGTHYLCLFNVLDKENTELCVSRDFVVRPGLRMVRKPGITNDNCTDKRYQPIVFSTDKFSDCMYIKSGCEEEGQVVVSNGKGKEDRTCRCDYSVGYSYIIQPRNPCSCVPSEEDCSCIKKYCNTTEELSADYKCISKDRLTLTVCNRINPEVPPTVVPVTPIQLQQLPLSTTFTEISGVDASVVIVLILLILIAILLLFKFRVFPELQSLKAVFKDNHCVINKDDKTHTYKLIEGCSVDVVLTYKSLFSPTQINIRKVATNHMPEDKNKRKKHTLEGKIEIEKHIDNGPKGIFSVPVKGGSLNVPHLTYSDSGTYEVDIVNRIGVSSTLKERWENITARFMYFIYPKINYDIEYSNIYKMEFIICFLPKVFIKEDIIRGETKQIDVETKSKISIDNTVGDKTHKFEERIYSDVKSVVWFRLNDENQPIIIHTDDTNKHGEIHRYIGGDMSSPTLTINQTCMGDGGKYCCVVVRNNGEMSSLGWELRIIPQESAYSEMQHHRADEEFVTVPVVNDALNCLMGNGIVLLKGRKGTGKTQITLKLASELEEKGFLPVFVKSECDVMDELTSSKVLYIFDKFNEQFWKNELKHFLSIDRSKISAKVIFTCRWLDHYEFKDLTGVIKDLNRLRKVDKRKILTKYLTKSGVTVGPSKESNFKSKEILENDKIQVKLDEDSINLIVETEPLLGFPLMARQFCQNRHNLQLGEKYFSNPPRNTIQKMAKMRLKASRTDASIHDILRYVILVYTALYDDNAFDINGINDQKFSQVIATVKKNTSTKIALEVIKDAADSLLGDYLVCSDNVYAFFHEDLLKALLLSDYYFTDFILQEGPLKMILEMVRGNNYPKVEGETVLCLDGEEKSNRQLVERLTNKLVTSDEDLTQSSSRVSDKDTFKEITKLDEAKEITSIGKYIYEYWLKDQNQEVKLCKELFRSLTLNIKNGKILPWKMITLVRAMTSNGNDSQIYSKENIPDNILVFGILSACQDKYFESSTRTATLSILLDLLELRLRAEQIQSTLRFPLDLHGNTFFHYLVIFDDTAATLILNCYLQSSAKKEIKDCFIANDKNHKPIDMTVVFGKQKLFKIFWNEEKEKKKVKENLLKILEEALQSMNGKQITGTEKLFDVHENFEPCISRSVLTGSKDDYELIKNILKNI